MTLLIGKLLEEKDAIQRSVFCLLFFYTFFELGGGVGVGWGLVGKIKKSADVTRKPEKTGEEKEEIEG